MLARPPERARVASLAMNTQDIPAEILAFFERYRDAFVGLDGHAVADLYAEPSGIAQDGVYTHWAQRASAAENMSALCQLYRERGLRGAAFQVRQFIDQGQHYAVADLAWRLDWCDGKDPTHFRTTYNLVRTEDGWKVLLCTAYSELAAFGREDDAQEAAGTMPLGPSTAESHGQLSRPAGAS